MPRKAYASQKATATTLLQSLEASPGVTPLHRTSQRVNVTPNGKAYDVRAAALLAELRDVEDPLSQLAAPPRGRVRVDAPTLIARSVILPALPAFFSQYPGIDLALSCDERHSDLISQGIDCALRIGEINDASVVARRAVHLHLATCAAPSYVAIHGALRRPRELSAHRSINRFSPHTGDTFQWVFSKAEERIAALFPSHLALEEENGYVTAAEAGIGVAQPPAFILKDVMERGTLALLLPEWLAEHAPPHLVYPPELPSAAQSPHVRRLVGDAPERARRIQLRSTLPAAPASRLSR